MDEYLHPKIGDSGTNTAKYFDTFALIDRHGLFYPVLLQEMHFLGNKVFGGRRDSSIVSEVSQLVEFLKRAADRKVGQEIDLDFDGSFCKFGIVIVGRSYNLTEEGGVWVRFIRNNYVPQRLETIYLLGPSRNQAIIDNVCNALGDVYEVHRTRRYKGLVHYEDRDVERSQYLVILRKRDVSVFQPSA